MQTLATQIEPKPFDLNVEVWKMSVAFLSVPQLSTSRLRAWVAQVILAVSVVPYFRRFGAG